MGSDQRKDKAISELYAEEEWTREFMHEIYDMFGVPISTDFCYSKTDKLMFVWSMMTLVQAMKKNTSWIEMKENLDPSDAAHNFVKSYFEETGSLLLENTVDDGVLTPDPKFTGGSDEI